jgi:hypothetical protein
VIYLTRALFLLRKVSHVTIKAVQNSEFPSKVAQQFLEESTNYHKEYVLKFKENLFETIWAEAENLSKFLMDFDAYDIIHTLRAGPLEVKDLESKFEMDKSKFKKLIKDLKDAKIITQIKDGGKLYTLLLCNPEISTVYPEWLIQRITDLYNEEEVNSRQAIHYLEVLKMSHPSQIALMSEIDEK